MGATVFQGLHFHFNFLLNGVDVCDESHGKTALSLGLAAAPPFFSGGSTSVTLCVCVCVRSLSLALKTLSQSPRQRYSVSSCNTPDIVKI